MNEKDVAQQIGCCGKACRLCKDSTYCDGCKSHDAQASRRRTRDGCYHYSCCHRKGIEGCWQCAEFPCAKDLFVSDAALYLSAFLTCIHEEGKDAYARYAFHSFIVGVSDKDYLDCHDEEDAMELLKKGKRKVIG